MDQYIKENRTEDFSPIYKEYKQHLKPIFKTDNLLSQTLSSKQIKTIHCNSSLAEETINGIIDYFNEQSHLNNNFKNSVLNEINKIELTYPTHNEKLESNIETNSGNSFITPENGTKIILDTFIKYSYFSSNSTNNYFEDINYTIESANEVHDSSKLWVAQTIDEPWFK